MTQIKTIILSERFFWMQAAKGVAMTVFVIGLGGAAIALSWQHHDWQRVFLYLNVAIIAGFIVRLAEYTKVNYHLWRMWYDTQKQVRQDLFMREIVKAIKDGRINANGECNCPNCRARRGEQ